MAGENHFQEAMAAHHEMVDTDEQPWKSVSSSSAATALESINDCFECNICLDHAQDPVVTLCGHLYCWPCMYKWVHFQSASSTPEQSPQCPVCKAEVSQATLVPLYGRGNSLPQSAEEKKGPFPGLEIPCRPPPAPGVHALVTTSTSTNTPSREVQHNFQSNQHHQQYYSDFYRSDDMGSSPMFTVSGSSTNAHPMVGMFGEMVYARMFGNAAEIGLFGHPNSYYLMSSSNPRVRRQEMKAEKSLNRISIFLFCCVVLCLLSF